MHVIQYRLRITVLNLKLCFALIPVLEGSLNILFQKQWTEVDSSALNRQSLELNHPKRALENFFLIYNTSMQATNLTYKIIIFNDFKLTKNYDA